MKLNIKDGVRNTKFNFLLVMPRIVQNIGDGYVFPLGVAYVSSSMKKAGFNVFTLNLNHYHGNVFDIIKNLIEDNNIHVIATGALSPQYHLVKNIIESAKKIKSNIITIVGGGIISAEPEIAMEALEFVDYGVIGEGEITMCELAYALENGVEVTTINGLIFKDDLGYIKTNPRKEIDNIDSIPYPDYEGFELEKYLEVPGAGFAGLSKPGMISMVGSRSCIFKCTFCFHMSNTKYRIRSLDNFFEELDYIVSRYNIKYIYMADELFLVNLERAKEFCNRIKKYNITWSADFRIDKIKPEILPILKNSGLDIMFFGIESADNRILKSMRKGITIEQTEIVLNMVYNYGIAIYGCFIFGDIEETYEIANNTLKWWREHSEYQIHLTLIKPFPGTYIYKYACKNGIIKDPIQYLKDGCPQINISKMSNLEFTEVMYQISEAQYLPIKLKSIELLEFDPKNGRETISGICTKCLQKNIWENIKLFSSDYIFCKYCGQKYDTPCLPQIRENVDKNIDILLKKYGKIAIWGMTLSIMNMFKNSKILNNPNIFPIDISESKIQMNLYGKKIHAPSILNEEDISVVIIAVPSHGNQIFCQVKETYPKVNKIIDICQII